MIESRPGEQLDAYDIQFDAILSSKADVPIRDVYNALRDLVEDKEIRLHTKTYKRRFGLVESRWSTL